MGRILKPYSIQVELTEGCNRLCDFCGLSGLRTKPMENVRFLETNLAMHIAGEISRFSPRSRVEFAMHGEPLLNPNHRQIISTFRAILPNTQFMLTTNGRLLMQETREKLLALFCFGIDILLVDTYQPERDTLRASLESSGVKLYDFYEDENTPSPWYNHHRSVRNIVVMMDDPRLRSDKIQHKLINHTGLAKTGRKIKSPLEKTCVLPYREMAIAYNGEVCVCCNDFARRLPFGSVGTERLADIWGGEGFEAARRVLGAKKRTFLPCNLCDRHAGMRAGLLPKYPEPTEDDWLTLEKFAARDRRPTSKP